MISEKNLIDFEGGDQFQTVIPWMFYRRIEFTPNLELVRKVNVTFELPYGKMFFVRNYRCQFMFSRLLPEVPKFDLDTDTAPDQNQVRIEMVRNARGRRLLQDHPLPPELLTTPGGNDIQAAKNPVDLDNYGMVFNAKQFLNDIKINETYFNNEIVEMNVFSRTQWPENMYADFVYIGYLIPDTNLAQWGD